MILQWLFKSHKAPLTTGFNCWTSDFRTVLEAQGNVDPVFPDHLQPVRWPYDLEKQMSRVLHITLFPGELCSSPSHSVLASCGKHGELGGRRAQVDLCPNHQPVLHMGVEKKLKGVMSFLTSYCVPFYTVTSFNLYYELDSQRSHGSCTSADHHVLSHPPAFPFLPRSLWNPTGPSNPGHRTVLMAKVTYGASSTAKPPKDQSLHPWPCGPQCILGIPAGYQNTRIQEFRDLGSGLNFRNGNNGKGSRAKIAHAAKHTCLSNGWDASVLGSIPGHTALLPRQQLSAILLCPVLL